MTETTITLEITLKASNIWEFDPDMGGFGRFDTFIDVKGHPEYNALRYYLWPGSIKDPHGPLDDKGQDYMEWVKDGEHYANDVAPVPDNIRREALKLVRDSLKAKLCNE